VWTYDHLSGVVVHTDSALDVWTNLGAIATATKTIGLGPLVANVTTRHPAVTAVAAATLCGLAPGRVTVGLGAGAGPGTGFAKELTMVGIEPEPASVRREMLAEAIDVLRGLWMGQRDYKGQHFQLDGASGFLAADPPPIIVGCNGPRLATVAGETADGANFHATESELPRLIAVALAAASSRPFEISVEAPPDAVWEDWLAPDGERRGWLADLGVSRVMVVWRGAHGLAPIEAAAQYL
jgi:alkanesulfonate monooxygenase SsuD/methylene tetrahydromethanopterin reductase-like flavin-dependent oxidoreductase (luciferase family)